MIELRPCPECGVPEYITGEHLWLDNGDIVQKRELWHRMFFIESENLDFLFENISQIIGVSIERIVIAAVRRAVRPYLKLFVPDEVRELVQKKRINPLPLTEALTDIARMMGLGDYRILEMRYEQNVDDYSKVSVREAFSLPICVAIQAAAMEAILGYDCGVTYEKAAPGVYEITTIPSEHPEEFKGRLSMGLYHHQSGGIELERCAHCGGPRALSEFRWRLERGVIENEITGRRMTLFTPAGIVPVFHDLEMELGETIPQVVVESQRRFIKTGFHSIEEVANVEDLRDQLALNGLGNLREFKIGKRGLSMRLDNAILHLMIVGMMQGIFETALNLDSRVDWEYSEEGDLKLEVTPVKERSA